MTFITQPDTEGETAECPNCNTNLIARWTDYKGQWKDKLQWQTIEPRKSHYTKDGDCKDSTITQETKLETPSVPIADTNPILESILSVLVEIKETLESEKKE